MSYKEDLIFVIGFIVIKVAGHGPTYNAYICTFSTASRDVNFSTTNSIYRFVHNFFSKVFQSLSFILWQFLCDQCFFFSVHCRGTKWANLKIYHHQQFVNSYLLWKLNVFELYLCFQKHAWMDGCI